MIWDFITSQIQEKPVYKTWMDIDIEKYNWTRLFCLFVFLLSRSRAFCVIQRSQTTNTFLSTWSFNNQNTHTKKKHANNV